MNVFIKQKTGWCLKKNNLNLACSCKNAVLICLALIWAGGAICVHAFNYAPVSENAGSFATVFGNPADGVYELDLGVNRHFLYTPLFANVFLLGTYNDLQGSSYLGAGTGLRLMPWPNFSPFLGGGAALEYSVYDRPDPDPFNPKPHSDWFVEFRGEAGFRYSPHENDLFFELSGQYRYGAGVDDGAYWLIGLSIGGYLDSTGIGISRGDYYNNRR